MNKRKDDTYIALRDTETGEYIINGGFVVSMFTKSVQVLWINIFKIFKTLIFFFLRGGTSVCSNVNIDLVIQCQSFFEDKSLISQLKLSLKGMSITGYRRGIKLNRRSA